MTKIFLSEHKWNRTQDSFYHITIGTHPEEIPRTKSLSVRDVTDLFLSDERFLTLFRKSAIIDLLFVEYGASLIKFNNQIQKLERDLVACATDIVVRDGVVIPKMSILTMHREKAWQLTDVRLEAGKISDFIQLFEISVAELLAEETPNE